MVMEEAALQVVEQKAEALREVVRKVDMLVPLRRTSYLENNMGPVHHLRFLRQKGPRINRSQSDTETLRTMANARLQSKEMMGQEIRLLRPRSLISVLETLMTEKMLESSL